MRGIVDDLVVKPKVRITRQPTIKNNYEPNFDPTIYYGKAYHLGDCWIRLCKYINLSMTTNNVIRFIEPCNKYKEILPLLEQALILNISKKDIPNGAKLSNGGHLPNVYVPTRIKWCGGVKRNRICYQFDGRSSCRRKNPPEKDLFKLVDFIYGVDFVRLGGHLSLEKCVKIMASSDCFLGVDSGMSHIAHSVGVPTFIIKYRFNFDSWHVNAPPFEVCHGTDDAIDKVTSFMERL